MKKIFLFLLAAFMMAFIFIGCSSPVTNDTEASQEAEATKSAEDAQPAESPSEERVTLTWAVFETDNYTAGFWQHIIDTFETDNPNIKIEKVLMTGDSRPQFLKTMLSAGNMPDINVDPVDLAKTDGVYAEVPADLLSNYEDASIVKFNGKVTLVPAYKALRSQVYYNKEYFEKAGITSFPTTKEEFTEACKKLEKAGYVPLITAGSKDIWATGELFWIADVNSEVYAKYPTFNEDLKAGKVSFTDPVIVDALTYWQNLVKAGYFHKGSMSFSYPQANAEFLKGSAAMFFDGAWSAPTIDNSDDEYAKKNIGVSVFPSGANNYCTMPQYWAVSETCKNKDAAFKFCEYVLGGNKEIYEFYLKTDGVYSVTKEPVKYPMGSLQTQFVANYDGFTLVPEISKMCGDYSLPTGLGDFLCKALQNIYTGANVIEQMASVDAEYLKLQK